MPFVVTPNSSKFNYSGSVYAPNGSYYAYYFVDVDPKKEEKTLPYNDILDIHNYDYMIYVTFEEPLTVDKNCE